MQPVRAPPDDFEEFVDLKQKAKRWEEQTLMGIGVKSRVQDTIPEEQVSVFHFGQLNRHQKENKINRLVTDEGCVIEDPTTINKSIISFFDFVLATKHSEEADKGRVFLETIQPLDLSLFNLENAFSLSEFSTVVANSVNNKSPGSDGIPYEFYKSFWISIGPIFTEMCNKVLQDGGLCESQGSADIRLVPKCDAPQKLSDYRPISLLNSDYKLLSAAMSNRLKKSLPKVIQPAQKGGVPGRKIINNLVIYRDFIQHIDDRSTRNFSSASSLQKGTSAFGAIPSVDLEKAFDRVDREILWQIIKKMGFSLKFIAFVKTLYSVAKANILNGCETSGCIPKTASLRQGCPMSMLLSVIYIEPLLRLISSRVVDIHIPGGVVKVRALVDDLAVFISSDSDLSSSCETLDEYCEWSGAKVQRKNTKALGLGSWKDRPSWPVPWLESTKEEKMLGISFSASIEETTKRTWGKILSHLLGLLRCNISRRLTLHQRATFVKERALSRAMYVARVLPFSDAMAKEIESAAGIFIWDGKMERPQPGTLLRRVADGGLGLLKPGLFFNSILPQTNL